MSDRLLEDGAVLLLEDGGDRLLEDGDAPAPPSGGTAGSGTGARYRLPANATLRAVGLIRGRSRLIAYASPVESRQSTISVHASIQGRLGSEPPDDDAVLAFFGLSGYDPAVTEGET